MAGRPKKPEAEVRTNVLRVRLTETEREVLDRAAHLDGLDTSTWVRHELLSMARAKVAGSDKKK